MGRSVDPHRSILTMHELATGEVAGLMEGFYSNIEDGLFELAYRNSDADYQRFCFDLMRELRYRRPLLASTFSKSMSEAADAWFAAPPEGALTLEPELEALADAMAGKCMAHFSGLLTMLSHRVAEVTGLNYAPETLPIGPVNIARLFVSSCRRSDFEPSSIAVLRELFLRFVLDRMGSVYGRCNRELGNPLPADNIPVLLTSA